MKTKIIEIYDSLFCPRRTELAYRFVIPYLNTLVRFDASSTHWEVKNLDLHRHNNQTGTNVVFLLFTLCGALYVVIEFARRLRIFGRRVLVGF